jgi:hypothetical protein
MVACGGVWLPLRPPITWSSTTVSSVSSPPLNFACGFAPCGEISSDAVRKVRPRIRQTCDTRAEVAAGDGISRREAEILGRSRGMPQRTGAGYCAGVLDANERSHMEAFSGRVLCQKPYKRVLSSAWCLSVCCDMFHSVGLPVVLGALGSLRLLSILTDPCVCFIAIVDCNSSQEGWSHRPWHESGE